MSDAAFVIRNAEIGDAEAMGLLHVRAWQAAYRGVMPDEYLDTLDAGERITMWRERIARTDLAPMLVAEVDGQVVGFTNYGAEYPPSGSNCGQLYAINLDPDHWRRGIGRALVRRVTEALRALGYDEAVLWVVPENQRARALYESEGWAADGAESTDDIMGVTVTDIRYRRSLTS
jgi:ribosomal protein S18 acetylase RimI-like enzyme